MQASFGHLDGYSAIYYTYMWSLVIAKICSLSLMKRICQIQKSQRKYKDNILVPGGSKPANDLVKDFWVEILILMDGKIGWKNNFSLSIDE